MEDPGRVGEGEGRVGSDLDGGLDSCRDGGGTDGWDGKQLTALPWPLLDDPASQDGAVSHGCH